MRAVGWDAVTTAPPPKHRKHLMTPGQPRPAASTGMSLTSVQRWIMSTLAATTLLHMALGVVVAARFMDERSSQIGLLVISGAFGLFAMVAALLIHRRRPTHPLVLLGLLPPLGGAWWIFG
jgi:hypothetical protein